MTQKPRRAASSRSGTTPPVPEPDNGPEHDDYVLSEQIGHLLRRAYQRHTAIFQNTIPDDKLTSVQFAVLTTVRDHPNSPLVLIARRTAIDHATLRDIVLRLKRRGLLLITPDQHDRRQRLVSLSTAGMTLVDSVIPDAQRITELTMANLSACERLAAIEVLRKLSTD
ncbi:MarR family transcriptional regulator [Ameyamaea chiangmaiensis NBRC 103196]|uniref:Winged helix-turn-helix transcriptional regulator n=1 Tax=Ameyamaea chiangmaiensis TaxID=442969 RepID=A0A850PI55_9PROT|nr:MarR family winged helix-turn-helix transcriptional regulator [Ameyamaea chiangmaiensis]MBS4075632.1 winged helix-turn-helix transcriptional regulator [Ameyamaea chiangmaiensis]NVN41492.1 winged helix-turn-helix transcriptional regulator [Ameyamaea chiangmaiensis]GBQ70696.1 MarR family transcriptional regulator [Ameyamaea chiangmaiensis NBRC 103196]